MTQGRLAPSAAEQVHAILSCASTAHVLPLDPACVADDGLATWRRLEVMRVQQTTLPRGHRVLVEVADPAPVAVRERIRGRVRVEGAACLDSATPGVLRVQLDVILLEQGGLWEPVDLEEYRAAEPDPLARREAALLGHLQSSHRDLLDQLTRLVDAEHLQGVIRVAPLRMDRYGLVLRLEYASRSHGYRIAFPELALEPADVRRNLNRLLASAVTRTRQCRPRRPQPR